MSIYPLLSFVRKCAVFVAVFLSLACITFAGPARAQELLPPTTFDALKSAISDCANRADDVMRIQCFDKLTQRMGLATSADKSKQEQTLAKYGFWQASTGRDEMSQDVIYLRLFSSKPAKTNDGVLHYPQLVISCKLKSTDLYLDWKAPITLVPVRGNLYTITYHIDNDPLRTENWQLSKDKAAVYSPDAVGLIRLLKNRQSVVINLPLGLAGEANLAFNIKGLDQALNLIVDHCYKD